ncbi:MAG: UDP-N-acetylmuramoyl-tripeptide--D-alanyl-D-alanine ligase [Actinomycetota bacterium]|nr:UDP-N-acetylmuramoyl-tripeptide--D-alanyl-D-alanine ligase [Actinomycetota bacterium]
MGRADPFFAYSLLLRTIIFAFIPALTIAQYFRLRRGLHVFQLEGYKRTPFLRWCSRNPRRALWLAATPQKKPLVMTGRARRTLVVALALFVVTSLVLPGLAHLTWGGWPADVGTWAVVTVLLIVGSPLLLTAADILLTPVQASINRRFTNQALARLAQIDPLVVGITGSFGKTSTRAAVQGLIAPSEQVIATPGSFNTPLGVVRTINESLEELHHFLVVEMGARHRGDIAELCRLVRPRIGVLTAIGSAHLESFGSLETIAATKYELIEALPEDGLAVMNVDDAAVRTQADSTTRVNVVRYGLLSEFHPHITASNLSTTRSGTRFELVDTRSGESCEASTRLLGSHSIGHVLAGAAVALAAGRRPAELVEPIAALAPVEHRLQLIEGAGGVTVIDDAYNSNSDGAAAALEVLQALPARRRVVVTPGIIELGPQQDRANEELGRRAASVADTVVVVARTNRAALLRGANGSSAQVVVVDSLAEAQAQLASLLGSGDAVLFENDLPDHYEV